MKLLHDGAGVAVVAGGSFRRGERRSERAGKALPGSSPGYIAKRDEPPFPLGGGRAGSVATIFEIYRGRRVRTESPTVEEIISTYGIYD